MYQPAQEQRNIGDIPHGRQLVRYGLVGLLNTGIDFALTNTLVILTGASGTASLFGISLLACLIATLNSYRINKYWTFGYHEKPLPHSALIKYFGVAFLAMMVNTSVFLFVYHFLIDGFQISRLVAINLAKLVGVGTASIFAFLGYRISVFRTAVVEAFRQNFRFGSKASLGFSVITQLAVLTVIGVVVRGLYLYLTTAVYGEAVNYGWIAQAIANGQWDKAQAGWTNPFCFWEALFFRFGLNPIQSSIGASLIPGVLLAVPVAWIARCLYGEKVAWLVGLLTALHPRLVVYSCNGYSETFYLLALTCGVALVAYSSWKACSKSVLLLAGLAFGLYFCVRNEGFILVGVLLMGLVVLGLRSRTAHDRGASSWTVNPFRSLMMVLVVFFLFVATYSVTTKTLIGHVALFQKTSVFELQYSEQLDPQSSAREVYGPKGAMALGQKPSVTFKHQLSVWFSRFPANLLETLKSTPGVLLTPFWFFAFFLPLFARSVNGTLMPEWPWLVILAFPFVIYPLLYVEPRLLIATLFPIHLFGAAGLLALATFLENTNSMKYLYSGVAVTVLALCLVMVAWRGAEIEQGYAYNIPLAAWIDAHVPPGETLVGCGYGFVSTTGYLAQRPTINRLIHYDPRKIIAFVKAHHSHWLVLYEAFMLKVNPELLPVLDRGLPGAQLAFQIKDDRGRRIQVYRILDRINQVFGPDETKAIYEKPTLE